VLIQQRRTSSAAQSSSRASPSHCDSLLPPSPAASQTSLPISTLVPTRNASIPAVSFSLSTPGLAQPAAFQTRAPKIKPKKPQFPGSPLGRSQPLAGGLRRSTSAAALREASHHDDDVQSALAQGLLTEDDINVYRMRTPWEGGILFHPFVLFF
jgi:hypothetical protein